MNKITEKQQNAKQSYLDNQEARMLVIYQNAGKTEQRAIFRVIDSLLPILTGDIKRFWLSFRQKLERLSEQTN